MSSFATVSEQSVQPGQSGQPVQSVQPGQSAQPAQPTQSTAPAKPLVSFVIPCYHSASTVGAVVDEIERVMREDGRFNFEVVLVNDNPPDDTWRVIQDLGATRNYVRGVCLVRNFGQHAALMAGYRQTRGDIVVSLDDDGQTPPSEVFKLIDALQGNVDVVYASYPENAYSSTFRKIGSKINDKMAEHLIGKPRDVYLSSYLAAKRPVIDRVVSYTGPYPYIDGLMLQCCTEVRPVPVRHDDRAEGQSGYSLGKLLSLWVNGFTSFSIKPLRFSALAGTVFACVGFIAALIIVFKRLVLGDTAPVGWLSLICLVIIFGGLIMMMIGMVGEYVGRIFMSINSMPQYYIREKTFDGATGCKAPQCAANPAPEELADSATQCQAPRYEAEPDHNPNG